MRKYSIPDMTCGHCKKVIEEAIHQLDAGAKIEVDLDAHVIEVATQASTENLLGAIKEAGYEAKPL